MDHVAAVETMVEAVEVAVDQEVVREVRDLVAAVAEMAAVGAAVVMEVAVAVALVEAERAVATPSTRHPESNIAACCGLSARHIRPCPAQTDRRAFRQA